MTAPTSKTGPAATARYTTIRGTTRGSDYTIIEISIFEGRSESARRALIAELFSRIEAATGIAPHSVEITITETPKLNWGIRGQKAADLSLNYCVEV